jgi:transcriptional regulator with XRE-family HTH domain
MDVSADRSRHRELADFLRTRRERMTPESAGLPRTGRRRTPGLRREELAALAGVGVTWYTWLEQGRSINVSTQVLGALSGALRLDPSERAHLFTLAGARDTAPPVEERLLSPLVQRLLDQVMPFPGYVLSERWDVLAWNSAAARVLVDFGAVPASRRNMSRILFGDLALRERMLDWQVDVPRHVAMLRAASAAHNGEPAWERLLADLCAESPEFQEIWDRHEVASPEHKVKRFRFPEVGTLRLESTSMWLAERSSTRVIVYVPADDESAQGLRRLVTPALFAVPA